MALSIPRRGEESGRAKNRPPEPVSQDPKLESVVIREIQQVRQSDLIPLQPIYFGEDTSICDWFLTNTLLVAGVIVHEDAMITFAPVAVQNQEMVTKMRVTVEWSAFERDVGCALAIRYLDERDRTRQQESAPLVFVDDKSDCSFSFDLPPSHFSSNSSVAAALGVVTMSGKPVLIRRVWLNVEREA